MSKAHKLLSLPLKAALMAGLAGASVLTGTPGAFAVGFDVQQIKTPGPAVRMSSAGYLTGTYKVKCSKLGGQPRHTVCYYAPWYYDGRNVTKVQWPVDWNFVYSLGINDSFELIGREYRGSLSSGGWLYSGGVLTYSGSLQGGGGSLLAAINNLGVAVGTAQTSEATSNWISRAVTFQNVDGSYVLEEIPAYDPSTPTTGVDINDEGDIAGTYTEIDGSQHAFAYVNKQTIDIPGLTGATSCQAVRLSQVTNSSQLWVAGNCGDRGFVYKVGGTGELTELYNLDGSSGGVSVQSVNGWGEAVGTVAGKAVMWATGVQTADDLNQFTAKNVTLSRGSDINDSGTILASDVDSSGNVSTYLLSPTP